MAAQPVREAGKACSALLSFTMARLETHSYPGRSESTLFTRPEVSKVRGLQGSASEGNCLISRFFHKLEVSTMRGCIRTRSGKHRVTHNTMLSRYFGIDNDFTTINTSSICCGLQENNLHNNISFIEQTLALSSIQSSLLFFVS